MKTTLISPDGLMREVKIRAIHEDKKLKDRDRGVHPQKAWLPAKAAGESA